ncbi:TonB-dependent receptor [Pedobacter zeae]|uniref:Iron complex outermembrane receptor protein n=1 Tax=Pedobacter zeae TaxID=1737356 RepID=A0A7W6P696_9SPHI|nr:TonB-dependent receptor [Pedobacter zeae]MBB4108608.1 iron complex outermembrane receptor protein [Pedobacter zeae]GGG91678.1 TonB-dependent receptor [Pedobacter zeae]
MKHPYISFFATAFIIILSTISLYAQTGKGTISGKVVDSLGNSIPFANVQVKKQHLKTTSDKTGTFNLQTVPAGNQQVKISVTGYHSLEQEVSVAANDTTEVTFVLKEQTEGLNDVIISASRRPESLSQTPSSVTVLTAKELSTQSAISPNLANILSYSVPGLGFSTNQTGNSGQTLRGRNVLVLIDGIPQSTPLRAGGRDIRSIDPSVIGRVEVIKGATAIYGNGAEGGLINYITKKADDGKSFGGYSQAGITGNLKGDSTIGYRFSQQLYGKTGKFDYLVSGMFEKTGVFRDAEGLVISPEYGLGETRSYNGFVKLGYNFSPKQRLQVMYNYFSSRQHSKYITKEGVYGQSPAIGIYGTRLGEDEGTRFNHNANLQYTNQQVFGRTDLTANVYYQDFYTIYSNSASFFGGGQSAITSTKKGARVNLNTPLNITDRVPLQLNYGLDLMNDKTAQSLTDGRLWVPKMNMVNFAPYLQASATLINDLVIKGGLRVENINIDVDDFNTLATGANGAGSIAVKGGKLNYNALVFNAGARYSKFRFFNPFISYAQSFSVFELGRVLRAAKSNTLSQLETKPIIVNNYEAGFSSSIGKLNFSAAYYYSTSKLGANLLEVNGTYISQRIPERVYGFEIQADYQVLQELSIGGNYAQVEGKGDVDNDGNFNGEKDVYLNTTRIPPSKTTVYLKYSGIKNLSLDVNWMRVGNRDRFKTNAAGKYLIGEGPVKAFNLFNVAAAYQVTQPLKLTLGIENLLNKVYYPAISQFYGSNVNYVRGNGRRFNLSLGYAF